MPAKPVRVIVSLDRADPATAAVFGGILAVARRRGWRLVDASASDEADGRITDDARPAGVGRERVVTVTADPFSGADVCPDAAAIGRAAAEHFFARGFRRFNYAGEPGDGCGDAFSAAACHAGGECGLCQNVAEFAAPSPPVGCLVRTPTEAARWIDDARAAGRKVPTEVAILTVGDDVMACECAAVTLSAIDIGAARLGRIAAERLHRLLRGRAVPNRDLVEPLAIIERESTATLAVDDVDVAAAVRFICEHAAGPLRVGDVVRASGLDRRTLERRFAKYFDRSPAEMIRRTRVELASKLVRETSLPMTEIARASGFRLPQHLAAAFKAIICQTPTDYRAAVSGPFSP